MSQHSQADGEAAEAEGEAAHPQDLRLLKPEQIAEVWISQDPVGDLFSIFTEHFNPGNDPEYAEVDDNKIRVFAEFQIYNMIFAKNDLKLDDEQTANLLDILWTLLAINQDGTMFDGSVAAQEGFQNAINAKFGELKGELIDQAKQGVYTKDHLKSIMGYMKSSYFKHFRLIDFVVRNKQVPTLKSIRLFYEKPAASGELDQAEDIVEPEPTQEAEGEGNIEAEGEGNMDPNAEVEGIDERLKQTELSEEERNAANSRQTDHDAQ